VGLELVEVSALVADLLLELMKPVQCTLVAGFTSEAEM
jgi:hypothetical protein